MKSLNKNDYISSVAFFIISFLYFKFYSKIEDIKVLVMLSLSVAVLLPFVVRARIYLIRNLRGTKAILTVVGLLVILVIISIIFSYLYYGSRLGLR